MYGLCDSCEERADHLFDLTRLPEFKDIVRRLNYRKVCQNCYDDMYAELRQEQPDAEDRRSEKRFQIRLAFLLEGTDRHGKTFSEKVFSENISLAGVRISTILDLEVGSILKLKLPDFDFEAVAIVELVWQDGKNRSAGLKVAEANEVWKRLVKERIKVFG
ncbi:MAG: hypothetical protein JNN15_03100 [Blastocatellia bacterium]|nr:hypothetical protein [Blastocatellia bacterium]